ncbi:MAG TPA: tripartite tricarboxylate transporter substrate-binding protein [Burkholderiales bacterium]|nr:tripartite tricarboxylate transporter substrate-binding protein [Burkholderiales bacterium]
MNAAFNPKLPYRAAADFSGVILVATAPVALTAHQSVPAKTLKELIALAQAAPGKLNYGSAGVGGSRLRRLCSRSPIRSDDRCSSAKR